MDAGGAVDPVSTAATLNAGGGDGATWIGPETLWGGEAVGEDAADEPDATRLTPALGAGAAAVALELSKALASTAPPSGGVGAVEGKLGAEARVGVDVGAAAARDGTGSALTVSTLTVSTLTGAAWLEGASAATVGAAAWAPGAVGGGGGAGVGCALTG